MFKNLFNKSSENEPENESENNAVPYRKMTPQFIDGAYDLGVNDINIYEPDYMSIPAKHMIMSWNFTPAVGGRTTKVISPFKSEYIIVTILSQNASQYHGVMLCASESFDENNTIIVTANQSKVIPYLSDIFSFTEIDNVFRIRVSIQFISGYPCVVN